MATISVVVPAAGCGARAALNGNKILAPLLGKPILWHTLRALAAQTVFSETNGEPSTRTAAEIVEIVVAVRDEERETVRAIFVETAIDLPLRLAAGGATRAASVYEAAKIARGDFLLVHDAARPCLTVEVTERVVASAVQNGAAIAALGADDTVKRVSLDETNGAVRIVETLDRSRILLAQTPQMFRRDWLLQAFDFAFARDWHGTDCASYVENWLRNDTSRKDRVLENSCEGVAIVRGDARNLKVTYADDLARAAQFLEN